MREELEQLKTEVAQLTQIMKEKAGKGQDAEVKELSDKLAELQKEVNEKKIRFETGKGSASEVNQKEVDSKMDELLIAAALLTRKDGRLDTEAYANVTTSADYRDAIKASGWPTAGTDGQNAGTDGAGQDFVPSGFSSTLLEEIWLKLEIANLFKRFNMPNTTYTFPFAPDNLTARTVGEGVAPTKDKFTTDQIIFTAKKIMSNVDFTDEIEQDSIIAILPLVRTKLIESFALGQEQIALNGDTTSGAGNINGNLSGTDAQDVRLAFNGIRKIDGATTLDISSGAISSDNLRSMRAQMGKYGKAPSDLAYIVTMKDYNEMLKFSNYQTLYAYGAGAVILQGELGRLDNIPIIVTELLPTTADGATSGVNASGVKDATAGNNTKNICGIVNRNAYMWGDRKSFGLETFRNPYNQITSLIGSQRLSFAKVLAAADKTAIFGINY